MANQWELTVRILNLLAKLQKVKHINKAGHVLKYKNDNMKTILTIKRMFPSEKNVHTETAY